MFTAEVTFPFLSGDQGDAVDAVSWLLGAWFQNGQVAVDIWPMTFRDGFLRSVVLLPDRDALRPEFSNRYVQEGLASLLSQGVGEPTISVDGFDPGSLPACGCPERTSFILFTNYITFESPVRCGDCFNPVPLYQIPTGNREEHFDVVSWQADYKACDTLQMHCTVGERFAEQQLYRHDSALSRVGRELCEAIAVRTGKPTYYWLHKSRGQTKDEELRRRCPSCNSEWLLPEPWHGLFEFRCDQCHLLSNIACSLSK